METLLPQRELQRFISYGEALIGVPLRLLDLDEQPIIGDCSEQQGWQRTPLTLDFEPLAYLEAPVAATTLKALAALLEWGMARQLQYLMASTLHSQAIQEDYLALQQRNKELASSEERYRLLATQLEQRVAKQVQTIKEAERHLYEREKLASVGYLAAGVAHEINNPISFIKSNLKIARD